MCLFSTLNMSCSFSWQAIPIQGMSGYSRDDTLWSVELALHKDVPHSPTGYDPAAAETLEVYKSLMTPDIISVLQYN